MFTNEAGEKKILAQKLTNSCSQLYQQTLTPLFLAPINFSLLLLCTLNTLLTDFKRIDSNAPCRLRQGQISALENFQWILTLLNSLQNWKTSEKKAFPHYKEPPFILLYSPFQQQRLGSPFFSYVIHLDFLSDICFRLLLPLIYNSKSTETTVIPWPLFSE